MLGEAALLDSSLSVSVRVGVVILVLKVLIVGLESVDR